MEIFKGSTSEETKDILRNDVIEINKKLIRIGFSKNEILKFWNDSMKDVGIIVLKISGT